MAKPSLIVSFSVILLVTLPSWTALAYQRGNRAQFTACYGWCLDHNRYPASQRQCIAGCCKYYVPGGNDDGVYTCSVVTKQTLSPGDQGGGGGQTVSPPVLLPPKSLLP